jgi:hypothetical protein
MRYSVQVLDHLTVVYLFIFIIPAALSLYLQLYLCLVGVINF